MKDAIRQEFTLVFTAKFEAEGVRNMLPVMAKQIPLQDLQFFKLGEIDKESGKLEAIEPVEIPKDIYKWNFEKEAEKVEQDRKGGGIKQKKAEED